MLGLLCVLCVQERQARELGAANGKLQRRVETLSEHENQLNKVGATTGQQQPACNAATFAHGVAFVQHTVKSAV